MTLAIQLRRLSLMFLMPRGIKESLCLSSQRTESYLLFFKATLLKFFWFENSNHNDLRIHLYCINQSRSWKPCWFDMQEIFVFKHPKLLFLILNDDTVSLITYWCVCWYVLIPSKGHDHFLELIFPYQLYNTEQVLNVLLSKLIEGQTTGI